MSGDESRSMARGVRRFGWIALAIGVTAAAAGIGIRLHAQAAVTDWTETQAVPTVAIVSPQPNAGSQELILPGTLRAYLEAPIYARVNGYLKHWYVDIGAHVRAGQVMAEIETPELDQQIKQAQSDLDSAVALETLAASTAKRWQKMLASESVSKQETDEKSGDYAARQATRAASAANLERLREIAAFRRIVAPFDGIVTARNTDVGALINAGAGAGQELFRVADMHAARVYIDVPQTDISQIHKGMKAELHLPEQADLRVTAAVSDISQAIRESSRTMQVELMADNANGSLLPGEYVEVHLPIPAAVGLYTVPTTALLFRQQGLQLATLGPQNHVVLKAIQLAHEDGGTVTVSAGLNPDDQVIDSPPDSLSDGESVRVAAPAKKS
jgi:RND family efflux transporter MFP subunit